jgi:hypothetical protein
MGIPSESIIEDLEKLAGRYLVSTIIPLIARKSDTKETCVQWSADVSRALVSGVLLRLALKHRKDLDDFFLQAMESLSGVTFDDLSRHDGEDLPQRLERWVELFKRSQYAVRRRSSRTGKRNPHPLIARAVFELAKVFAQQWRGRTDQKTIRDALRNSEFFEGLTPGETQEIADMIADDTMPNSEIALELSSKKFGIEPDSFDRHYLRGTLEQVKKINKALKGR